MQISAIACRSYYSLLRGAVSVEQMVEQAKISGYDAISIADVNGLYGVVEFLKAAEKFNIKPIIATEILTDTQRAILIAENRNGYENICDIITSLNLDSQFDLIDQLSQKQKGIICICSDLYLIEQVAKILPPENLFAGCDNPEKAKRAKEANFNPIASMDFNIIRNEDILRAKLLAKIRQLSTVGSGPADNVGFNLLITAKDFYRRFENAPEAIANNRLIAQRCFFELIDGKLFLPKVQTLNGKSSFHQLSKLAHCGLARRYDTATFNLIKKLEYELGVINQNGFSDYFLVVKRIIDFAKSRNIPVDVRGSAAGSLVSYVLGFTRVCPVENKLYFERFMNPGRKDCPDIDIDLCWRRRDEVINFCYENWGYDYVAMICTISRYRYRSALRDTARALGFNAQQIAALSGRTNQNQIGLIKLAQQIISFPRHIGVHCGGIVITPKTVRRLAPLEFANKGIVITQYDKDAAEQIGLVKLDLLGNRSLSTVNEIINIIKPTIDIDNLANEDAKTASMLSTGDSLGVFQCESPGMRQLLRATKVKNKHDVSIALSLIRPGPSAGGMKTEYIQRHISGKPFEYLHPKMKDIFGDTYGVMLFQEDIMKIAVEIAGYSIADADRFRSEVSKKVSSARIQKQYEEFVYKRADKAGLTRSDANAIWEQILTFASYSYCRAHATVYANIAWHTAFLKANYPQQFYCSLFNNHHGMYPLRVYVWDAIRKGIKILPPHINKSQIEWCIERKSIRAGLNTIKGLSCSSMVEIISKRNIKTYSDLTDLRYRTSLNRKELEKIVRVGCCDGLGNTRAAMMLQLNYPLPPRNQFMLFNLLPNPSKVQLPDYTRMQRLQSEIETTGIAFSCHPAVTISNRHVQANELSRYVGKQATVAGFIATSRKARTSDNRMMGFITLEDCSGLTEVSFFPDKIDYYERICRFGGPVWIKGKVTEHLATVNLECISWGSAN